MLDWIFGKGHTALLGRAELKTLVHLHANEVSWFYWFKNLSNILLWYAQVHYQVGKGGELSLHETTIMLVLSWHTRGLIISKGHSRIPVYSEKQTNIVGIILVINQFDMFYFIANSIWIIFWGLYFIETYRHFLLMCKMLFNISTVFSMIKNNIYLIPCVHQYIFNSWVFKMCTSIYI